MDPLCPGVALRAFAASRLNSMEVPPPPKKKTKRKGAIRVSWYLWLSFKPTQRILVTTLKNTSLRCGHWVLSR